MVSLPQPAGRALLPPCKPAVSAPPALPPAALGAVRRVEAAPWLRRLLLGSRGRQLLAPRAGLGAAPRGGAPGLPWGPSRRPGGWGRRGGRAALGVGAGCSSLNVTSAWGEGKPLLHPQPGGSREPRAHPALASPQREPPCGIPGVSPAPSPSLRLCRPRPCPCPPSAGNPPRPPARTGYFGRRGSRPPPRRRSGPGGCRLPGRRGILSAGERGRGDTRGGRRHAPAEESSGSRGFPRRHGPRRAGSPAAGDRGDPPAPQPAAAPAPHRRAGPHGAPQLAAPGPAAPAR